LLLRGTVITSALTLLSRILGFVRDLLVARLLGASLFADVFFVAFRIPNLLRSFLAEGALTSAFVPVFAGALAVNHHEAQMTFRRMLGFLLSITIPLSIIGMVFAPQIVMLIAPGFASAPEKFSLCVTLTEIMFPYIACVSIIAMLNSALNALNIFGASAWAQVTMNGTLIVGAVLAMFFEAQTATVVLALSVLVGGIVQILAQLPACSRARLPIAPSFQIISKDVSEAVRLMIPATVGASVYQVTIFLSTILASTLADGSVSWLFYADRIVQFPIGIFSIALASVLLPALAQASARADVALFSRNLSNSLRFTNFVIIPMATGLWALALPITEVLFERGAFSHDSSIRTAQAIKMLALGLWATSCHSMVTRAFIARKDTRTPTWIGLCALAVSLTCSLLLMGPLPAGGNGVVALLHPLQSTVVSFAGTGFNFGHVGLAAASSIAAAASLVLIIALFCLKMGGFPWRDFLRSLFTSVVASVGMLVILWTLQYSGYSAASTCVVGALVGTVTYSVASLLMRSKEAFETLALLRRRLVRR
jgi:putative peptidoglycan lipid II flippase